MFSALFNRLKKLSKNKTFQVSVFNFAALFAVVGIFVTLTAKHVIIPQAQTVLPAAYSTVPADKTNSVNLEQQLRAHNPDLRGMIFFNGLNSVVVIGPGLDTDQLVVNVDVVEMRRLAQADNLPVSTQDAATITDITALASGWWWCAVVAQLIWFGYLLFGPRQDGDIPCRAIIAYDSCSNSISAWLKARKIAPERACAYAIAALMAVNIAAFSSGLYSNNNLYLLPSEFADNQPVQGWQLSHYLQSNPERFQRVIYVSRLNTVFAVLSDAPKAVPGVPGTVPHTAPADTVPVVAPPAPIGTAPAPLTPSTVTTIAPAPAPAPTPSTQLIGHRASFPLNAEGTKQFNAFIAALGTDKIEHREVPALHNTNLIDTLKPVGMVIAGVLLVWALAIAFILRNLRKAKEEQSQPRSPQIFDRSGQNASGPTGSSGTAVVTREEDKKTFADVAGCQEAIDELVVVQKKIMRPRLYKIFGAPVPSGVILYGPPGTGKTLLARALAGEVGGSFQALSGSEFVEMYVGVGAKRVREAYAKARADARRTGRVSIVFIDEFDALAKKRGTSTEGGNREYEQTLNQLLVEMNGFGNHGLVLTMAATNRLDILDEAVLRPGRFDIKVKVPKPDRKGRSLIYGIYLKKLKLVLEGEGQEREANYQKLLDDLARRSHDFSGAEIEGAIKDGATIAVERQFGDVLEDITPEQEEEYRNRAIITERDLHEGIDKMAYGTQIRSRVRTDKERWATAVHEVGHASVPTALGGDPVNRITIVMTDKSLGLMDSSPEEGERYDWTREQFMVRLQMMLAGRAAEKVILNKISTGASNDFERASQLARQMVGVFGMSESFGNKSIPLDQYGFPASNIGENMLQKFNDTWGEIIDKLQADTEAHIEKHREQIERCARALYEEETLTGDEFRRIWAGQPAAPAPEGSTEAPAAAPESETKNDQ